MDWDIHFENVDPTPGSVTPVTAPVSDNETTTEMTYAVNFTKPGDFYEFTVDIVNDGTIDAMIDSFSNLSYEADGETTKNLPAYLSSTVTYDDGINLARYHYLKANTSEKIKVRVAFRTDINPSDLPKTSAETTKFKFSVTYKQADNNAKYVKSWVLPEGKTTTTLSTGDEICLKADSTQCFNFLYYDGTNNEDVVMLSKYNLKVGYIYNSSGHKTGEYTSADMGYGKQNSSSKGFITNETRYGTVAFSATNYWYNGSTLKPEYGTIYPANVYNATYKTEPDFSTTCDTTHCFKTSGYSVAYYVENYKTILTGYGVTIKDARLLKYSEATDSSIGCSGSNYNCPTIGNSAFITNTSFWLGTASGGGNVWGMYFDGSFVNGTYFGNDDIFGVRPVIVISKSSL